MESEAEFADRELRHRCRWHRSTLLLCVAIGLAWLLVVVPGYSVNSIHPESSGSMAGQQYISGGCPNRRLTVSNVRKGFHGFTSAKSGLMNTSGLIRSDGRSATNSTGDGVARELPSTSQAFCCSYREQVSCLNGVVEIASRFGKSPLLKSWHSSHLLRCPSRW